MLLTSKMWSICGKKKSTSTHCTNSICFGGRSSHIVLLYQIKWRVSRRRKVYQMRHEFPWGWFDILSYNWAFVLFDSIFCYTCCTLTGVDVSNVLNIVWIFFYLFCWNVTNETLNKKVFRYVQCNTAFCLNLEIILLTGGEFPALLIGIFVWFIM